MSAVSRSKHRFNHIKNANSHNVVRLTGRTGRRLVCGGNPLKWLVILFVNIAELSGIGYRYSVGTRFIDILKLGKV